LTLAEPSRDANLYSRNQSSNYLSIRNAARIPGRYWTILEQNQQSVPASIGCMVAIPAVHRLAWTPAAAAQGHWAANRQTLQTSV
jgi:hypothetical protein